MFFSFFRLHTDQRVDFLEKWMPPSSSVGSITPSKQSKLVLIFQNKKTRLRLGPLQAADWLFRKKFCVRLIIKPLSQIMSHGFWLNGLFPEKSSFQNKMVPVRHQESMGVKASYRLSHSRFKQLTRAASSSMSFYFLSFRNFEIARFDKLIIII